MPQDSGSGILMTIFCAISTPLKWWVDILKIGRDSKEIESLGKTLGIERSKYLNKNPYKDGIKMWGPASKLGRHYFVDQNDSLGIEINIWEKNHWTETLSPRLTTWPWHVGCELVKATKLGVKGKKTRGKESPGTMKEVYWCN